MRRKLPSVFAVFALVLAACSSTPAATTAPTAAPPSAAPATATAAPTAAPPSVAPSVAPSNAPPSVAPSVAPSSAAPSVAPSSAAPSGATGGSISFTRFAEAAPFFHIIQAQSNQYMLYYLVFDTLVALDLSDKTLQTLKPRMAESWDVTPDALNFTFHLRKDIKWHDGTPFTADDLVYTATWAVENRNAFIGFPPAWWSVKGAEAVQKACDAALTDATKCGGTTVFDGIKKVDDYTVQFVLEKPDVFFIRTMADAPSVIMPAHLLKGQTAEQITKGDFANKAPVGTGPFKFDKIVPDQYYSFVANADYWGGRPKVDTLIYKAITSDTALAQLESGDLDVALNVGAANFDRLSKVDILNVQTVQAPGVFNLIPFSETDAQRTDWNKKFGYNIPPVSVDLSDKRVRQAMFYGIDRRTLNDQFFGGRNRILWNPPGFKTDYPGVTLNEYPFDPVKAKALLDAAVADGKFDKSKTIRFMYATDLQEGGKLAPVVKQQLEAIGFKIELIALDIDTYNTWAAALKEDFRGKFDMAFGAGGSEGLSPSRSEQYFKCSGTAFGRTLDEPPANQPGYYNCDLRGLFYKARTIVDQAERDAVYGEIAKILNEDLPEMYFWQLSGVHGVNKRVQGLEVASFERYTLIDAANWSVTP